MWKSNSHEVIACKSGNFNEVELSRAGDSVKNWYKNILLESSTNNSFMPPWSQIRAKIEKCVNLIEAPIGNIYDFSLEKI